MKILFPALAALLAFSFPAIAEEARLSFGGDEFTAGQTATIAADVPGDAFIAGYDVSLSAPVTGDAHFAGFNVRSAAPVTGDVYAGGFSVTISAPVGGDLTAMGNSVATQAAASIARNARLVGQTVTLGAPVAGRRLSLHRPWCWMPRSPVT